jgi:hypothetical protein
MTFSMTINETHHIQTHLHIIAMLSVVYAVLFMLSVANKPFMLSVIMLNVIMLSVIMLSVVAPFV